MEEDENIILGVFKKCSICNNDVMCTASKESIPETHSKKCKEEFENGNNCK